MLYGNYASGFTGFFKYLFPPVWISIFGWGTLQLFVNPESVRFNGVVGGAPAGFEWIMLAIWLAGSGVILGIAWRLVWVRIADGRIYIKRFWHELPVDPGWIRSVDMGPRFQPRVVTIKFMDRDGRDRVVWLMPTFEWPSGRLAEPHLVEHLQQFIQTGRVSAA